MEVFIVILSIKKIKAILDNIYA